MNDEVPTQIFICSRGFSEADWNNAYATWSTAINYDEEQADEFYPEVDCPKMKASSENVNRYMGEVDELDLFGVEPDETPLHINRLFEKINPGGKRKRRDFVV